MKSLSRFSSAPGDLQTICKRFACLTSPSATSRTACGRSPWRKPKRRYSFLDVARAQTPEATNEASLYRIRQHSESGSNVWSWGLLSAEGRMPDLEIHFKAWRFGQIRLQGVTPTGSEPFAFVVNITREQVEAAMARFGRPDTVYSGVDTGGEVPGLLAGDQPVGLGGFEPDRIARVFSGLTGSQFHFGCRQPFSVVEGTALQAVVRSG